MLPYRRDLLGKSLLLGVAWLAGVATSLQADFKTRVYPVPINIEGEKIFTQLHLKLGEEDLGFPLVGRPQLDGENEVMISFFEDLMTNQVDRALERTWMPNGVDAENVRELLGQYHEVFSGYLDSIRIDKIVALGDDRLLLWSFPFEDEKSVFPRTYRSLRFVRPDPVASTLLFEGVKRDPLAVLINSLYQEGQSFPDGLPNHVSQEFEYEYAYPPQVGENAVEFLFNGETVKSEVFGPATGAMPTSLSFYRHAMDTMVNGQALDYAALLGPDSRERLINFSQVQPEQYEAMVGLVREMGKTVFFVLEADPIYYLFYLPSREGVEGASFRYDMVYRSPEGEFLEVNVFRESFFDDIILQRGLFEEPFLRPTLIAANLIEDERKPLSISVPQSEFAAKDAMLSRSDESPSISTSSTKHDRRGLPWWVWLIVGLLVALLAYYFWRHRADTTHA